MTPTIEIKRHSDKLSPEETDEVIEAVADLIVDYLSGKETHEQDNEQPKG